MKCVLGFSPQNEMQLKYRINNCIEALAYHGSLLVFSINPPSNRKRMPTYIRCSITNATFKPKADLRAETQVPQGKKKQKQSFIRKKSQALLKQ